MGEEQYVYVPDTSGGAGGIPLDMSSPVGPLSSTSPDLVMWQLKIEDLIKPIVEAWRGISRDKKGRIQEDEENRIMNEYGIQHILTFMRQVSKNMFLSNYKEAKVGLIMIDEVCIPLLGHLAKRSREFGLNPADRDLVYFPCVQFVHSALQRAQDAGERRALTESTKTLTTNLIRPEGERRGKFSMPKW